MPLVNTWIKNEDWDTYYQLASTKQWGEFIHTALSSSSAGVAPKKNSKPVKEKEVLEDPDDWHDENGHFQDPRLKGRKVPQG